MITSYFLCPSFQRLETAHELIAKQHYKVSEAMMNVGFKNLSHFSKIYKEAYGLAPSLNAI